MGDYIVRATAAEGQIRAFAITSRQMTEDARVHHQTSPVITAALGRLLAGAAMMGSMMKGEKDLLTVQIQCGGPAKGLTVTADASGHVKGFPSVASVELPPNAQGKLDVGGALGLGTRPNRRKTRRKKGKEPSGARSLRAVPLFFRHLPRGGKSGTMERINRQHSTKFDTGGSHSQERWGKICIA